MQVLTPITSSASRLFVRNTVRCTCRMSSSLSIPQSSFPILHSVPDVRAWRRSAFEAKAITGFVPTMGALHEGHLELVRQSLRNTDRTICSIFVNPAQFAPSEDLATYPRTLESDLAKLHSLEENGKKVEALFLPSVKDLYPDGIEQDLSKQRGSFVEVVGYSQEMEGQSRPTFFRGVATVVTKLFNIVQPDYAYFGQKDIQQCLILRRLLADLHMPHPPSPNHLRIIPTVRDFDNVALSSRNTYLSVSERQHAPILYAILSAAQRSILESADNGNQSIASAEITEAATKGMTDYLESMQPSGADTPDIELDYLKINDPLTLRPMDLVRQGEPAVLSGAVRIGKTRIIDNFLVNIHL